MIEVTIKDIELRFETRPGLFSPSAPDKGTLAMLSCVAFRPEDKVLDLGCGYGLVGIYAAHFTTPERVFMLDSDPLAIDIAAANARLNALPGIKTILSDGFAETHETGFTQILSNPPYHADFSVPKHFIEKGFNRLSIDGSMWMVTRRLPWYRNKLQSIFGGVRVHEMDGYFVFEARKKSSQYGGGRR